LTLKDDWNFLFGEASLNKKCAVASCFRLQGRGDDYLLAQYSKIVMHEVGHMLGLWHCTEDCLMQYRDSTEEVEEGPPALGLQCKNRIAVSKSVEKPGQFLREYRFADKSSSNDDLSADTDFSCSLSDID